MMVVHPFYQAVHGIVVRVSTQGLEVLLGQRINTGYADGLYAFPAGHVEPMEQTRQALVRELNEEIGLTEDFLRIASFPALTTEHRKFFDDGRPPRHYTEFFYMVSIRKGANPINLEPQKCADLRFFSINSLPENIMPLTAHAIEQIGKKKSFSHFGWEHRHARLT